MTVELLPFCIAWYFVCRLFQTGPHASCRMQ